MEAPAGKHKQQRVRWLIAACLLVLFGYPLSIGPVVWMFNRSHVPESLWSAFNCTYRRLTGLDRPGP